VSNDAIVVEAIAAAVRMEGHVPTVVSSGAEALRCIHTQHYDLVGTKFDLPGMNGEELACWIKALLPRQPIVLVMNERDQPSSRQPSAADLVLRKPFTFSEIKQVIYKLIRSETET